MTSSFCSDAEACHVKSFGDIKPSTDSDVRDSSFFAPSQVLLLEKTLGRFDVLPASQCNNIKERGEIEIDPYTSSPTYEDRE